MPQLLVNELSLDGQYSGLESFWSDLERILKAQQSISGTTNELLCSTDLRYRPVVGAITLLEAVHSHPVERSRRHVALRWLTKGPFWTVPSHDAEGAFEFEGRDVTRQALAEIVRRRLANTDAQSVSFPGLEAFDVSPLIVSYLKPDGNIAMLAVPNTWRLQILEELLRQSFPRVTRWEALVDRAAGKFSRLVIARDRILEVLAPYPFDPYIEERTLQLLGILDELMDVRERFGNGSAELTRLLTTYFVGREALFSDESTVNKRNFSRALTFPDPSNPRRKIMCSWHGKIRTPLPYRIHFDWPLKDSQRRLGIVYIGPKLTRS